MKFTKRTAKNIKSLYRVDITMVNDNVADFIKTFEEYTYRVNMECDLCDPTQHLIEDINGNVIEFITDEENPNRVIEVFCE